MITAGGNDYNDREIVSPAPHPASLGQQFEQSRIDINQAWPFYFPHVIVMRDYLDKISGSKLVFVVDAVQLYKLSERKYKRQPLREFWQIYKEF